MPKTIGRYTPLFIILTLISTHLDTYTLLHKFFFTSCLGSCALSSSLNGTIDYLCPENDLKRGTFMVRHDGLEWISG